MEHDHPRTVRFGDCDPAGIAYFPRFFDWFHQALEDWFDRGLRVPYRTCVVDRQLGFPAVHTEADFRAPCAMGEQVVVRLRLSRVGARSITPEYVVTGASRDDVRATGRTVVVATDLAAMRSVPLPEDLREAMGRYLEAPAPKVETGNT